RRPHALGLVSRYRRLGRGQPRDRHSIRGAGYIVHADAIAILYGCRVAAVFAADADFDIRPRGATELDGNLDHLAHAFLVDRPEWVRSENLYVLIVTGEFRVVVTRKAH